MKHYLCILVAFFSCLLSLGQTSVSGTVSDETVLMFGANISIKNTSLGVVSDFDGAFELQAKPSDTLVISYMGYQTKMIRVGNQKAINISLESGERLDEIVVYAQGIKMERRRWCCCYGTVVSEVISKKEDINLVKCYPNPSKNGVFQIKLLETYTDVALFVTDISGRLIHKQNKQPLQNTMTINLSRFPDGIYLIAIEADGKQLPTKKAVKG